MLLIAVFYRRCGRNLQAKLYTAINSLSANYAYLKMLYLYNHPRDIILTVLDRLYFMTFIFIFYHCVDHMI